MKDLNTFLPKLWTNEYTKRFDERLLITNYGFSKPQKYFIRNLFTISFPIPYLIDHDCDDLIHSIKGIGIKMHKIGIGTYKVKNHQYKKDLQAWRAYKETSSLIRFPKIKAKNYTKYSKV